MRLAFYTAMASLILPFSLNADMIREASIRCAPSEVFDAGYRLDIYRQNPESYLGMLFSITYGGPKYLGLEGFKAKANFRDSNCTLRFTQARDEDGNELVLLVTDPQVGSDNKATLSMNRNGRPIPQLFRPMTCTIDQKTIDELCDEDSEPYQPTFRYGSTSVRGTRN